MALDAVIVPLLKEFNTIGPVMVVPAVVLLSVQFEDVTANMAPVVVQAF